MINPGDLRNPIVISSQSTTMDEGGEPIEAWDTVLEAFSKIAPLTSKEVYALGSGFTDQATHKVTIRFPNVTIKPKMRVAYRSTTYRIQLVSDPDLMRTQLDLICLEDQ